MLYPNKSDVSSDVSRKFPKILLVFEKKKAKIYAMPKKTHEMSPENPNKCGNLPTGTTLNASHSGSKRVTPAVSGSPVQTYYEV